MSSRSDHQVTHSISPDLPPPQANARLCPAPIVRQANASSRPQQGFLPFESPEQVLPKPFELDCEGVALGYPCGAAEIGSNDEVERRGVAPTQNEAALFQSSTPSLAHRRCDPAIARTDC